MKSEGVMPQQYQLDADRTLERRSDPAPRSRSQRGPLFSIPLTYI